MSPDQENVVKLAIAKTRDIFLQNVQEPDENINHEDLMLATINR